MNSIYPMMPEHTTNPLRILHIFFGINETSAPYNEHCLPLADERDIVICTYFKSKISPSPKMVRFEGDDSIAGFYRGLKAALNYQEYDIIHIHSIQLVFFFLCFTIFHFKKIKSSTLYTVHSSFGNFKLQYKLMFIPTFRLMSRVVCCSEGSYDSIPLFYKRLVKHGLHMVKNGVDVDRIDGVIGDKWQYPRQDPFTIVTVGRLIELKNPLTLLNAFYKSADLNNKLIFMGEGNLRDEIQAKIKHLDIENQVELTGLITREQLYQKLVLCDLYVSTSTIEGLPVSVLEAMVCGCPVVLSDIPQHREIADKVNFIPLINPKDDAGFANEINRYKKMPASERIDIGKKCREFAVKNLSLAVMNHGYETIYLDMIKTKKKRFVHAG